MNREIVHLKGGVVNSNFELVGIQSYQSMSEDPDGSLWVVRAANTVQTRPSVMSPNARSSVSERLMEYLITPIDSILADGKGGFWLGGQTALVHWHDGVSDIYPIEALIFNVGQHGIVSLALGPDGSLRARHACRRARARTRTTEAEAWLNQFAWALTSMEVRWRSSPRSSIATATFGSLLRAKGLFRIHGNVVDH